MTLAFSAPDYVGVATGFTDVVYDVEWRLTATEGSDTITKAGATQVAPPDSGNFTSFSSLTNDCMFGLWPLMGFGVSSANHVVWTNQ